MDSLAPCMSHRPSYIFRMVPVSDMHVLAESLNRRGAYDADRLFTDVPAAEAGSGSCWNSATGTPRSYLGSASVRSKKFRTCDAKY